MFSWVSSMGKEIRIVFYATVAVLSVMLGLMLLHTGGFFLYIQDDAYIHLTIAKNFATHGVWGITPETFTSASSSPLWVAILSVLYLIVGEVFVYAPLAINTVAVFAVVAVILLILRDFEIRGVRAFAILGAVVFFTPLGPFAFSGMEHAPHMLAVLLFLRALSHHLLSDDADPSHRRIMLVMAPLVAGFRYEGLFLIAPAVALLFLRKRYIDAFFVLTLGAAPALLFGLWSLGQGGHFLPNSLLIKKKLALSLIDVAKGIATSAYANIKTPLFMIFSVEMALVLYLTLRREGTFWKKEITALAIILTAFVLQAVFGRFSWLAMFRYEAYLVLAGLLYLFISLRHIPFKTLWEKRVVSWQNTILLFLLLLLFLPFLRRTVSWPYAVVTAKNIHEVQYQMGRFFGEYYRGKAVGAIDIGALSYYGEVKTVDFWGLANNDVADARLRGTYGAAEMRSIADKNGVEAAALFDSWLGNAIPQDWFKVGTWTIDYNVSIGSDTLSFYAMSCADAWELEGNLRTYASEKLPQTVHTAFLDWKKGTSCRP